MGNQIRIVGILFVFGPLAAMFSEPFFEQLFDMLEIDTEEFAAPVASFVTWAIDQRRADYFLPTSTMVLGIGIGIWVHYLSTKVTKHTLTKGEEFQMMRHQIYELESGLERFNGSFGYRRTQPSWDPELLALYMSLSTRLKKVGVTLPKVANASQGKDLQARTVALKGMATLLKGFSSYGQVDEAKSVAKSFLKDFTAKYHQ